MARPIGMQPRASAATGIPVIAALMLLVACSSPAGPSAGARDGPASGSDSDGTFTLEIRVEDGAVAGEEPIVVEATLGHAGADDIVLAGSGSGVVFFTVTRLEDGLTSGPPAIQGDCAQHVFEAGQTQVVGFSKSGGFSADDPNAAFMRAYLADPDLRLPAGTWRIEATTTASVGECGGVPVELRAFVDVAVGG